MRELSETEVDRVSGGAGPLGGAMLGLGVYVGGSFMTGTPMTWSGATFATVAGGVTSGLSVIGGAAITGGGAAARTIHATSIGTLAGAGAAGAVREDETDS